MQLKQSDTDACATDTWSLKDASTKVRNSIPFLL
jgi:hypothetical protein